MAKLSYIKSGDEAFGAQLIMYKNNIPMYAAILDVTAPQVTAQAADADYFDYVLKCQGIMQTGAQQWSVWKKLLRGGGTPPMAGEALPPVFPAAVTAVELGIEPRFRALAQQNKTHPNYNIAIGEALGIEGPEHAGPDFATLKPEFKLLISGNRVEVGWGWGGFKAFLDMCEIHVDRGAGYVALAFDTTPGYVDTQAFPAAPAKWTYKAIYRVGDAQVGQWSNPVSIMVG